MESCERLFNYLGGRYQMSLIYVGCGESEKVGQKEFTGFTVWM